MDTITELVKKLKEPIPNQYLKSKSVGETKVVYIPWYQLANLLDERVGAGNWSWQVVSCQEIGKRLVLTGTVTIFGSDRSLSMTATGNEDIECSSYGDPSSNAEAMAMRRCAAKFGLGRDLWDKDKSQHQPTSNRRPFKPQIPNQTTNPFANQSRQIIAPYIREWGRDKVIQRLEEENMPTDSAGFKTQQQITELRELLESTFSIDSRSEYEAKGVGI